MILYENSRYSFRVSYPSDWTLGEAPTNNDGRTFTSPDGVITCHAYGFYNALTNSEGDPQTLDEFVDWMLEDDTIVSAGKSETIMAGQDALDVIFERSSGSIEQGVYILNDTEGRGLVCNHPNKESQKDFAPIFRMMAVSFKSITKSSIDSLDHSAVACSTLFSGAITPLADMQVFLDDKYTEVTTTSREAWNQSLLPKQVLDLESKNYTCYPMPFEFDSTDQSLGMNVEPAIKSVEWKW